MTALAALVAVPAAGAALYTAGAQAATWVTGVVRTGPTGRRAVALTFDDGPNPEETPRILDALAEGGARGTFFVLGERARRHPEIVRAAAEAGHDLGNHTYSHRHLWTLGPQATRREILDGAAAIADAAGSPPRFFRPPWGTFNFAAYRISGWLGEARVLWSVRPEGYFIRASAERIVEFVIRRTRPGAIVDLHDASGFPDTAANTRKALPELLRRLREAGYEVLPLSDLLA